ncbi:serine hydrolase [Candidatus Dojkabacteria bacterium]|uniref:Serine hydrolase n=1 Tax=Candidatus Dojkabacteria bacterium TaxID=2099670 RepID=A0A955I803_9BACT|nr:serine hydrolase [Candidatus Dojkabacteria bacterium]
MKHFIVIHLFAGSLIVFLLASFVLYLLNNNSCAQETAIIRCTLKALDIKDLDYLSYTSQATIIDKYDFELINTYAFEENKIDSKYLGEITLIPVKEDIGITKETINTNNRVQVLILKDTKLRKIDFTNLEQDLNNFLGTEQSHFGIYLYDLNRNQALEINDNQTFPPASISKLPSVLLTLRDIDAGKYSFDTLVTVKDELKHTNWDTIGQYPAGTKLPLRTFIDAAILESNNSAHYHLHNLLGGLSVVNPRTQNELGAQTFFLDPHQATARSIGTVLIKLYKGEILSEELTDYMINLMKNTGSDLRLAIPGGVPNGVEVANKVGFLFGGIEGSTYSDSAIVYGEKTDYVLVVLNDKAPDYPYGYLKIKDISEIVYDYLN